jgi:hypothetical protein
MTAPSYPQQFPPPTPPPTPPTQYPVQPSYPVAPGQLPYAPQQQQPYAPQFPQAQGYPAPQYAPPQQPLAQGSIDDFFNQPSAGGGKSLAFPNGQYGTRHVGIVTRPLRSGDVQQQTDTRQVPQFFKDGRPKFVMKVPLQMQPSAAHPDGLGTWFVKGQARDELVRAMAEAGAPAGPPEAGAIIDVTYVSDRQSGAGMNPAKQFRVVYTRPNGAPPAAAVQAPPAPAQVAQPAPVQPGIDFSAMAAAAQPDLAAQQPVPAQPAAPQPLPPSDLTEAQQQLLAKLTGG